MGVLSNFSHQQNCNKKTNEIPEYGVLSNFSHQQNCSKKTNKIPEYAREYKNEWLFIRGINKEFKYFVDHIHEASTGLFESHKVDRVKYFMKRFLRGQEREYLQDISDFEINYKDVKNLIQMKKNFLDFDNYIGFYLSCHNYDDLLLINFLVSITFIMILNYFLERLKLNIKIIFIIILVIVIMIVIVIVNMLKL